MHMLVHVYLYEYMYMYIRTYMQVHKYCVVKPYNHISIAISSNTECLRPKQIWLTSVLDGGLLGGVSYSSLLWANYALVGTACGCFVNETSYVP